jgi:signal peptidase I
VGKKIFNEIKSWVIVILIVMVIRATFVEGMLVPTQSMDSTIKIGDAILFNRFIYGVKIPCLNKTLIPGRMPKHGNIVAFRSPMEKKNVVKRCIALAGDTVQVINKKVYVNGKLMYEPYAQYTDQKMYPGTTWNQMLADWWEQGELYKKINPYQIRDNFGPVVVPEDCIFGMGDNRDESFDCRFWGPLHKRYFLGKPIVIYMSIDLGGPRQTIWEALKFWQWKGVRTSRIGQLIHS